MSVGYSTVGFPVRGLSDSLGILLSWRLSLSDSIHYIVKAGEYQQAIKHYATANLFLRGVSPNLAKMHQVNFPTPMPKAKPPSDKERFTAIPDDESEASEATSTEEKSGAEDEGKNDEGYGDAAAKEAQSAQTAQPGVDEKYTAQEVRKQQIACLVNSSICYSKLEKWDRCKARAQE